MTRHLSVAVLLAGVCFATALAQPATQPAPRKLRFKPILSQQVVSNDAGGTRGAAFPWCDILAPTQVQAITISTQPILCWWVEKPLPYSYQCVLIDTATDDSVTAEPIKIPPVTTGGWQTIDLAKAGVTLQPDHTYQWNFSVAVGDAAGEGKPDVEPHSTVIKVVAPPADVVKSLATATPDEKLQLLSDHGYWLDAAAEAVRQWATAKDKTEADSTLRDLVQTFKRQKLSEKITAAAK